jgi:hypothetical protein
MVFLCLTSTALKAFGEMEVGLLAFLNSVLVEGDSFTGLFNLMEWLPLFVQ